MSSKKRKQPLRPQISVTEFDAAITSLRNHLRDKVDGSTAGACMSLHEILGLVGEEFDEFKQYTYGNDPLNGRLELLDIALAAIWGIASINSGTVTSEWDSGATK